MSIILNKTAYAEDCIKNSVMGKKPSETLLVIAGYYMNKGLSRPKTRVMLEKFLLSCDPRASVAKWSKALDSAIYRASKHEFKDLDCVVITDKEIETIKSLRGRQIQRMALALIALAKYWDMVNGVDTHWVNTSDADIMNIANMSPTIKRQSAMYAQLKSLGMIEFAKRVDNTNVRVKFVAEGEPAIVITDFRNVGYQYLAYNGEPYRKCERCGAFVKMQRSNTKYCRECAVIVSTEQKVNYAMKLRKMRAEKEAQESSNPL